METLLHRGASGDVRELSATLDNVVSALEEHFAYEEEHLIAALRQADRAH
jgi:hypothetical protein